MEKKDATDGMVLGFEIPEEERTPTVDQLLRIIIEQRKEIARLREEINRLKGVPPQPQRKPSMLGQDEPPRSDTSKKSRRKKPKFEFCRYFDPQPRLARGGFMCTSFRFSLSTPTRCCSAGQAEYPGNLVKEFFCATAFGNDVTVINFPAKTP